MKKIALSAFMCDPSKGSEPSYGWNWAVGLANKGFEVHCFTRIIGKAVIEKTVKPTNLSFHYVQLPLGGEKLYHSSTVGMYLYYIIWQWFAYRKANQLHKKDKFNLAHHVTWGSTQMGSFMYRLKIPLVFGPAGGGQKAPIAFKSYFGTHWTSEEKREKISRLMLKFNPACKKMLRKAYVVLASNPDTIEMAKSAGARNVLASLDTALPESFFPETQVKGHISGRLRLLWVGRFMPRKGILLLLEVMNMLKEYSDITLTVVGDGEMRDTFLDKIKEYGLENTVDWKGKVPYEAVKDFYITHDIFLFTSLRDSGGVQLVEAMAYSLPIVCLNLHGQAIIVNDETGIRCDCSTPEIAIIELKEAILKFRKNPELLIKKGNAAHEFARQQTWGRKIDNIVKNYYPIL